MKRLALLGALALFAGLAALSLRTASSEAERSAYQDAEPIDTSALSVHLAELTWTEVRALIAEGRRTAIVPTGGTEQNGPHMVLGKHDHVVRFTAGEIARALGDALVAPVVSYVPEGGIEPKTGHMQLPGTLTVPVATFESVLESTARSLIAHGFERVCFVGDSGDNQAPQARVAERLNAALEGSARVLHVSAYYDDNGQHAWLIAQGESPESIGRHAGIRDTSELLAVHPAGVRRKRARPGHLAQMAGSGVDGDPTKASAERGRELLRLKVQAAVRQIRATFPR